MLEELSCSQIEYLIDEWVKNQRDRAILKSRLLDGIKFETLSEMYDLSVTQVKTIVRNSEMILRNKK
jgi:Mor family transcriptional regulator